LLSLSLAGCISLPDIEPGAPDVEEPLPDLSVRIRSPEAKTYTNGAVDVSVEVANGTPEAVDLFAGGELLATLTSPYTFHWETAAKPEGSYTLTAKARRGTQTFTSEAREVVVDRTPPQVMLLTPEVGASGVRASHSIQAVLSEALNPASVTNSSTRLRVNGNEVAVDVTLSSDGKILTLAPAMTMALPAQVEVVLTEVRDFSGNSLLLPAGGWSWNVPDYFFVDQPLQITGSQPFSPSMQLDALGKPVIACTRSGLGYVQRWDGKKWEQLGGAFNAVSGSTGASPSLQLDTAGRAVVAWVETSSNGTDVYVRRWTGTGWVSIGSALSVLPGDTAASNPSLQLDVAGNPVVAFTEYDGQTTNAYVWRWNGNAWEAIGGALSAKPGKTQVNNVSLRLDPAGNPVVAWRELGDGVYDTAYVSRWLNGQWEMQGSVLGPNPGAKLVDSVSLTLDPVGNPIIAMLQIEINVGGGIYALRWKGDQWEPLGGPLTADAGSPFVQGGATGRPAIVWLNGDALHVMQWTGGTWETLGGHLRAYPNYSSFDSPSLQLNADGYPVVAWREALGSEGGVFVASFNY
jgi:hypothetical protein